LRAARAAAAALVLAACAAPLAAQAPAQVDITWMSIANVYFRVGSMGILADGYLTRIPQSAFSGGGGGMANTHGSFRPDEALVARVLGALGGPSSVGLLLTGHSHFDHSFDTPTWSRLTGARIVGPRTTCYQARAEGLPNERCTAVYGGEKLDLGNGLTMRVVRWNHSGDPATNPEQHDPVELRAVPNAPLRPGVAEDFPNGGGGRGFLFTLDAPGGRLSWFYQNSASPVDLQRPVVVEGVDYGAPLENLRAALRDAGLESVDLWLGTGGAPIAQLVLPVLHPRAYLPLHWDGLFAPFAAGIPAPYADPALERLLAASGVKLLRPAQYMDRWRLDREGVASVANTEVKRALGFSEVQPFPR
jgi:hypothetical protein